MREFCFTVDDNIRFLRELCEGDHRSIFDHPYMGVYRRLHEKYGVKVQLNLFYEAAGFDLSQMTERYREEWLANANWLKLSFHARRENKMPYAEADYDEVYADCARVHREILRFAALPSLAKTTTLHYCLATREGISALRDNGVCGLLGLYGTDARPRGSYQSTPTACEALRRGETVFDGGMAYGGIDVVLNRHTKERYLTGCAR